VSNESRFEESDEVGFVGGGTKCEGEDVFMHDGMAGGEGVGREAFIESY
jgi:hypothetical protein